MIEAKRPTMNWMDVLWLVLLAALALLPPVQEVHKQLILLAFGVIQLSEGWLIARVPKRGPAYLVLLKIALATLLVDHTGEIPINSYYYPIYYLPAVTAAEYFGPWATLVWTSLASAAYCSYLYPALQEFEITPEDYGRLRSALSFSFSRRWSSIALWSKTGGRRSAIRNWPGLLPRPIAAWSRRRPRRGVPSGWPHSDSFLRDSHTRFATPWV
jgi:hypothetical protein